MSANPLAGHSRGSIVKGFAALRTVTDPRGHDLLAVLEDEALWLHDMATTVLEPGFSRKAPDTPALRLVGGFEWEQDARSPEVAS